EVENIDFDHTVGTREVLNSANENARVYHDPMNTKNVNIRTDTKPKKVIIGDYWFDSEVVNIIELLCDFQDLFRRGYHELKGVHHSLGEMRIKLKEMAHPIRKRPYRMNLNMGIK
ncbi:hypothetical protein KI387_028314, partial [Taxus chinensis]